jgi:flagellar protein FlgJ
MDISSVGGVNLGKYPVAGSQRNSNFDSANTAAEAAAFAEVLKDLRNKAQVKEGHVVNEAPKDQQDKELKEACKGFEAMFLNMMYKQMRATVPTDTLFGESNAKKIYQEMHDEKLMDSIADGGGVGLADMLYKQLSREASAKSNLIDKAT